MEERARPPQQLAFDISDFELPHLPDDIAGSRSVRGWYAGLFAELLEQQRAQLDRLAGLEAKCETLRARVQEYRYRVNALEAERDLLRSELHDAKGPPTAVESWRNKDPLAVAG